MIRTRSPRSVKRTVSTPPPTRPKAKVAPLTSAVLRVLGQYEPWVVECPRRLLKRHTVFRGILLPLVPLELHRTDRVLGAT
jgi:hypothetical protein